MADEIESRDRKDRISPPAMDGWTIYCVDDYVSRYGIAHPEVALPLMALLTPRGSCSSRSTYVRRSVANHLNDVAKDNPCLAIDTASRWLREGGDEERRAWIVRHGMRSLIKAGDPAALALVGFDHGAEVTISSFRVSPVRIEIGESINLEFALTASEPTPVMVDYVIHHAKAKGVRGPKVFKLKEIRLEPGTEAHFRRGHRIREVSVRRIYPGPHLTEVQVNGRVLAAATVEVTAPTLVKE